MERQFHSPISSVAVHPTKHHIFALGFFNGLVKCCVFEDREKYVDLIGVWGCKMKRPIRKIEFSDDGYILYAICENGGLSVYDVKNGCRLRCIRKCHKGSKPHSIICLPHHNHFQLATGSETGEIKIWDMNLDNPVIATLCYHKDTVNAFALNKNCLLSVSDDCTLCCYNFRQKKLQVQSEEMHSELLSIIVLDKFTCVGAGDGYIEIFKNGEYGNILERIQTVFTMGVETMIEVKPRLLLIGGTMNNEIRFYHIQPHKELEKIHLFGGSDTLIMTKDQKYIIICSTFSDMFKVKRLNDVLKKVSGPDSAVSLLAQKFESNEIKQKKKKELEHKALSNFFNDLIKKDEEEDQLVLSD